MAKYIRFPWAVNGDRQPIPDASAGGNVSYQQGYTPDYSLPKTDPNRKSIGRQPFNQALNDLTANIKEWQEQMYPEFIADDGLGNVYSYSKTAVVRFNGVYYQAVVDGTTTAPPSAEWRVFEFDTDASAETVPVRDAGGTFKVGAPTNPAHPALSGAVRTINPSVVGAPDYYGTLVVNLDMATGSFDLPEETPVGGRVLVRKLNATQGTVDINAPSGETITRASLTNVKLNADGDFWLLEKVSPTRWELVDGYETGENANGTWKRSPDGTQICTMNVTGNSPGGYIPNTDYIYIYPISFIFTPMGAGILGGGLPSVGMIHYLAFISSSALTVRTTNNFTGSANASLRFNIIGRWY